MATQLWLATGNKGKVHEVLRLLEEFGFEIHLQNEISAFTQPPETGKTFLENAQIKARALHAVRPEAWVLGEDSGLCVEGLNHNPGVYSARYAGEKASDVENNMKVLQMLRIRSPLNRKAYFQSSVVIRSPEGQEYSFEGRVSGTITESPRGTEGFGYDSIFIPEGEAKTFAELGIAFKNKVSHRSKALMAAKEALRSHWNPKS